VTEVTEQTDWLMQDVMRCPNGEIRSYKVVVDRVDTDGQANAVVSTVRCFHKVSR